MSGELGDLVADHSSATPLSFCADSTPRFSTRPGASTTNDRDGILNVLTTCRACKGGHQALAHLQVVVAIDNPAPGALRRRRARRR
jgi:hypothetical protein